MSTDGVTSKYLPERDSRMGVCKIINHVVLWGPIQGLDVALLGLLPFPRLLLPGLWHPAATGLCRGDRKVTAGRRTAFRCILRMHQALDRGKTFGAVLLWQGFTTRCTLHQCSNFRITAVSL